MSAILLFCTAKVPAKVINQLMADCAIPELGDNIFSLVRTRDQEVLDEWQTEPPVQDYDTGFEAISDSELRRIIKPLITTATKGQSTSLAGDWFAVLDEKSEAQSVVVMHYSYPQRLWEPQPVVSPAEVGDGIIWWKWRVPFKSAWTLFNDIDSCGVYAIELYSRREYQDSESVLKSEIPGRILGGEMEDPKGN